MQVPTKFQQMESFQFDWIDSIPEHTLQSLTQEQQQYLDNFEKMLIQPLQRRILILESSDTSLPQSKLWDFSTFTFSDFYTTYGRDLPPPHSHRMIHEFQKRIDWKYTLEKEYQRLKETACQKLKLLNIVD